MHSELLLSIVLFQIGLHLLLQLGYSFFRIIASIKIFAQYGRTNEPSPAGPRSVWSRSIFNTFQRTPSNGSFHLSATGG